MDLIYSSSSFSSSSSSKWCVTQGQQHDINDFVHCMLYFLTLWFLVSTVSVQEEKRDIMLLLRDFFLVSFLIFSLFSDFKERSESKRKTGVNKLHFLFFIRTLSSLSSLLTKISLLDSITPLTPSTWNSLQMSCKNVIHLIQHWGYINGKWMEHDQWQIWK